jgi:hypothetical protein
MIGDPNGKGTTLQTSAFPYVLSTFIGMIAEMCIAPLVEFKSKMLFTPTSENPLSDKMIFGSPDFAVEWVSRNFPESLIFENDELAREFMVLNPQE